MNSNSFSIIMPVYLGEYPYSASDKENKFIRAINSVINQKYKNYELIIISDGCNKSVEIIKSINIDLLNALKLYKVAKQKIWGGIRNIGIDKADGNYIIYLDADDVYDSEYLYNLNEEINDGLDWYYTDDKIWNGSEFISRKCIINRIGHNGTSNIIHNSNMKSRWKSSTYIEDFQFIKSLLRESSKYRKLNSAGYNVCHIPNRYDI